MSALSEHHRAKCGVEGKCSVPQFDAYGPAGFCDNPAWGEQYSQVDPSRGESGKYAPPHWAIRGRDGYNLLGGVGRPYAPSLCCSSHGGPDADAIRFVRDGDMWCAFRAGFVNLAESHAGFGETQDEAERDLCNREKAS